MAASEIRSVPVDVGVRRAQPRDVDGVVALIAACDESYRDWARPGWEPPGVTGERARWTERLVDDDFHSEVAVEDDERVVGLVSWTQALELPPLPMPVEGLAHISAVFVHPSRWRQGVAACLLGRAEAGMLAAGFDRAELWTPTEAPARRFYESRGWRPDGRTHYYVELELPLVGYEKHLTG